jgi:hypothetical protein
MRPKEYEHRADHPSIDTSLRESDKCPRKKKRSGLEVPSRCAGSEDTAESLRPSLRWSLGAVGPVDSDPGTGIHRTAQCTVLVCGICSSCLCNYRMPDHHR